jgi:hypothetical protein
VNAEPDVAFCRACNLARGIGGKRIKFGFFLREERRQFMAAVARKSVRPGE